MAAQVDYGNVGACINLFGFGLGSSGDLFRLFKRDRLSVGWRRLPRLSKRAKKERGACC
jgi:hypothetical protein